MNFVCWTPVFDWAWDQANSQAIILGRDNTKAWPEHWSLSSCTNQWRLKLTKCPFSWVVLLSQSYAIINCDTFRFSIGKGWERYPTSSCILLQEIATTLTRIRFIRRLNIANVWLLPSISESPFGCRNISKYQVAFSWYLYKCVPFNGTAAFFRLHRDLHFATLLSPSGSCVCWRSILVEDTQ